MAIYSDKLVLDEVYTREQLAALFSITDQTLYTGVFQPKGGRSIWIFVTAKKTRDRTQYSDRLDSNVLLWEGQTKRRSDSVIINHAQSGDELLLFYRERKYEFPGAGFQYLGPLSYVTHTTPDGDGPSRFVFQRHLEAYFNASFTNADEGDQISEGEFFELVSGRVLDPDLPLDVERQRKERTEQGFLRKYLFGDAATARCGICGVEYPADLMVAVHLKARAECSAPERRDYKHVVAPMCKFGCDDLYEKGYIAVKSGGEIVSLAHEGLTPAAASYLAKVVGLTCSAWSELAERYFAWHRARHGYVEL